MTDALQWSAIVKAQDKVAGPPRPSLAWATSRRTSMKVYSDRTEIGDWVLPHNDVTHAHMYQTQRGVKNRVLEISTPDKTVQVNFNPGTTPEGQLPYPIDIKPFPRTMAVLRIALYSTIAILLAIAFFG